MDHAAFFSHAWKTIAHALADAGVDADLDLNPETIRKSVRSRCLAELKRLSIMIRRLIFLMALQVELAPLVPRTGSNYFEPDAPPAPPHYTFQMIPAPARECPHFLRGPRIVPHRGPVPAAPLVARWLAILMVLKHSQRRAKRLARTIQRWRERREARPCILSIPGTHSMPAALGLVSGALVAQLTEALKDWPDTG